MKLAFDKMSGAGNDFVVLHDKGKRVDWPKLAAKLCPKRTAIGADGLLVLKPGDRPVMRYYNADGSRAFCGNGSRCAALWFYDRGYGRKLTIQSDEGPLLAEIVAQERVRLRMPPPKDLKLALKLSVDGKTYLVHSVNTGVPHAVVPVKNLDTFPVFEVGRALRRHKAFKPAGTNVNFVDLAPGLLRLRTYERGVEDETLACGTGAAATAIVAEALGRAKAPVRLKVASGDILTIDFDTVERRTLPADLWLEGPAKFTFRGEIEI